MALNKITLLFALSLTAAIFILPLRLEKSAAVRQHKQEQREEAGHCSGSGCKGKVTASFPMPVYASDEQLFVTGSKEQLLQYSRKLQASYAGRQSLAKELYAIFSFTPIPRPLRMLEVGLSSGCFLSLMALSTNKQRSRDIDVLHTALGANDEMREEQRQVLRLLELNGLRISALKQSNGEIGVAASLRQALKQSKASSSYHLMLLDESSGSWSRSFHVLSDLLSDSGKSPSNSGFIGHSLLVLPWPSEATEQHQSAVLELLLGEPLRLQLGRPSVYAVAGYCLDGSGGRRYGVNQSGVTAGWFRSSFTPGSRKISHSHFFCVLHVTESDDSRWSLPSLDEHVAGVGFNVGGGPLHHLTGASDSDSIIPTLVIYSSYGVALLTATALICALAKNFRRKRGR